MATSSSKHAVDAEAVFNETQALDALGGDRELLLLVARAFVDDAPKLVERLRGALARGDSRQLQSAGHALKGTVRFFGDTAVYDLAYSLETQGRSGNLDRAQQALDELAVCVPRLSAAVAACCERIERTAERSSG